MTALVDALRAIGLAHTAASLDDLVALATKRRWSVTQILEHIAEAEQRERARRSLERRIGRSRLGGFKPLAEFDWSWPKHIDREAVESAARLEFLGDARNVVLVAPQGLGKTMIAQNIVHAALLAGHSALFITAAQMLLDLGAQESVRALDRRLRYYTSRPLLCIDEIGYLSYDARNADLLFQVVSRRYERKSLVLTTNQTRYAPSSRKFDGDPGPSYWGASTVGACALDQRTRWTRGGSCCFIKAATVGPWFTQRRRPAQNGRRCRRTCSRS